VFLHWCKEKDVESEWLILSAAYLPSASATWSYCQPGLAWNFIQIPKSPKTGGENRSNDDDLYRNHHLGALRFESPASSLEFSVFSGDGLDNNAIEERKKSSNSDGHHSDPDPSSSSLRSVRERVNLAMDEWGERVRRALLKDEL